MKSKDGFSHWVDGKKTWEVGVAGFFTRLRSYLMTSLGVGLPLAGVPFWWPEKLPDLVQVPPVGLLLVLGLLLFSLFTFLFFYTRFRTRRSLEIKSRLHQLLSEANGTIHALMTRHSIFEGTNSHTSIHEAVHLRQASKHLAETIAQYFKALTGDDSVGAVICIATASHEADGPDTAYATVGRSSALNRDRETTSEPLPRDKGFAKFFRGHPAGPKGVLFIEDITKATAAGVYHVTPNDKIFPDDFRTLAVVPITGWNGVRVDLIGILALTSTTRSAILKPKHVDLMKFTGEALGLFYTCLFAKLLTVGAMPTSAKGKTA